MYGCVCTLVCVIEGKGNLEQKEIERAYENELLQRGRVPESSSWLGRHIVRPVQGGNREMKKEEEEEESVSVCVNEKCILGRY